MTIKHFGHAGHFIGASRCLFHLCTLVNDKHLVSTVGDYRPGFDREESKPMSIGYDRTYETMVFDVTGETCTADGCQCGLPTIIPRELDMAGYSDAKSAAEGHAEMVATWEAKS